MKRHSYRPLLCSLIGAGLLSFALGACAHESALHAELDASARAQSNATARAEAGAEASADAESLARLNCLRHTGTRIAQRNRPGDKPCVPRNGRVYTRDDIDSTGAVELSEALRMLDPSIR
ncbi:MAG: hypothetical protein M3Q42_06845 [Pseudomonadota bacterium]|nr:hypothetical protein [Pseudomonadota bacterium]